jgi:hypothetical protein
MAVDVSVYNEIAKNNNCLAQNVCAIAPTYSATYLANYSAGSACGTVITQTINTTGQTCQQAIYPIRLACDLIAQPWCCCYWAAIPTLPSVTGGLLVCDTTYGRCGVSCAWTVPGGAQFLRFQMWGAGAMSQAAPCCCAISIPGSSGAYASVIIPAVPGCVYTLCAGCAACCYPDTSNPITTGSGCASYVTGYGLNGVCAEGGEVSTCCWLKRKHAINGVDNSDFSSPRVIFPNSTWICTSISKSTNYGWCLCANGGFCTTSTYACITIGTHNFITSCKIFRGNVTNPTLCCHFVIGTPGVWSLMTGIGNGMGFYVNYPPVTCYSCSCPVQSYTGCCLSAENYCGMCGLYTYPCQRPDNAPGRGGGGSMSYAGNDRWVGFPGNGGAICVQYL